jgi:hypothetical protein
MEITITPAEIAELIGVLQGAERLKAPRDRNPFGMSADALIDRIAGKTIEKMQAAVAAEDRAETDDDTLAVMISERVGDKIRCMLAEMSRDIISAPQEDKPDRADGEAKTTVPKEPAAKTEETPVGPEEIPMYDPVTEMYIVHGNAYIGKELWNKVAYKEFFNDEIRRLKTEGKTQQYIADRFKVTSTAVANRIARDFL